MLRPRPNPVALPLGPRPRTPSSGLLVEALFAFVTLSAAAMGALVVGRGRGGRRAASQDAGGPHDGPAGSAPRAAAPAAEPAPDRGAGR